MEKYRVIKDIPKGRTPEEPNRYSKKVIAKAGSILIAKTNYDKVDAPVELYTTAGNLICQVGSTTEKEYCVKVANDIPITMIRRTSLEENLISVFKEHLDSQNQLYGDDETLESLVELVKKCNSSSPERAIGGLFEVALKRTTTN